MIERPCRGRARAGVALALLALATFGNRAAAHDSRPLYIELTETAPLHYQLQWKTPPSLPLFAVPTVSLPRQCEVQSLLAEVAAPDGPVRRIRYRCPQALAGQTIAISFPGPNPSLSSLVRYSSASGERHLAVLGPERTHWTVPHAQTVSRVAGQYTRLGIEHIFAGVDHLLFVACLLWIAGTWRRILATITGFTLAHSVTLALSALEVVRLPVAPVEAVIALSVVFLATEIVKGQRASLTWRHPIAVSSAFGLLHGFGFAAALGEIGLPQKELVTGLLFFNIGVEIGQLLFAAGVIALIRAARTLRAPKSQITLAQRATTVRTIAGYGSGGVAAFWLIERCAAF